MDAINASIKRNNYSKTFCQLSVSVYHVPKFLTFLLSVLLIFSGPHSTEALPLLSHKHHAVFAERYVRHENLTPICPPALSHRAAGRTPAKHLTEVEKYKRERIYEKLHRQVLVTISSTAPRIGKTGLGLYNCLLCAIA